MVLLRLAAAEDKRIGDMTSVSFFHICIRKVQLWKAICIKKVVSKALAVVNAIIRCVKL